MAAEKRSLRLTVTDDLYREIERYSRTLSLPIATTATLLMSFGAGALEAFATARVKLRAEEASDAP